LLWTSPEGEISRGYREDGYLPEAFVNIIALLGWNPGTEQEILSMQQLIEQFDLNKVGKAGCKYDPEKAKWFNKQYLKELSQEEMISVFSQQLKDRNIEFQPEYLKKVAGFVIERITLIPDFWEHANFFFQAPQEYDGQVIKKKWKPETSEILLKISDFIEKIEDFTSISLENAVKEYITNNGLNFGNVLNPLRLALTGGSGGPHIFDILETLGKPESLERIKKAARTISV